MRLWSLHPRYLDAKGLVAAWREGLLAQKVLEGETSGYRNHPQLVRFRESGDPLGIMGNFLTEIAAEASRRGYSFDGTKIHMRNPSAVPIPVAAGQVRYERTLLASKLALRDARRLAELPAAGKITLNPVFTGCPGGIEPWEKVIPEILAKTEDP